MVHSVRHMTRLMSHLYATSETKTANSLDSQYIFQQHYCLSVRLTLRSQGLSGTSVPLVSSNIDIAYSPSNMLMKTAHSWQ